MSIVRNGDDRSVPERCSTCVIRQSGICSALSGEEVTRLSRIAHHRTFEAGQTILSHEEKPAFFGAIVKGMVKLTKPMLDGRQQIVGLLFPTDFLGRPFSRSSPFSAEAATPTMLCCFRHADFEAMLASNLDMKQHLLERTLDTLDTAHEWMLLLGRKTAEERVASLLHLLATKATLGDTTGKTPRDGVSFEVHLRRQEMADFLGLTYETVIRQIGALDTRGIIRMDGRRKVTVPSLEALRLASG